MIDKGEVQAAVLAQVAGWASDVTALKIGAAYQMLPELRGFWPFSSINESGNALDLSGQGRTLTNNGGTPRAILPSGLPYCTFNGSSQYWSRADEAGLDITGALTVGMWVYYNGAAGATVEQGIGKRGAAGALSYYLRRMTTGVINFGVSGDGTASVEVGNGAVVSAATWMFCAGRYTPSTELAVFVDDDKFVNTTGIPAAIFNSAAAFGIGAYSGGAQFMPGRGALGFVCAAALPDDLIWQLYVMGKSLFG